MNRVELEQQLHTLLELLSQEREMAKALDMEGLQTVINAKQELLSSLDPQPEDVEELQDLLRRVDQENRRNAFLLWTGLNWVRDMMGFFGQASMPEVYGEAGQSRTLAQGGRLLSGKV
jgi:flagellar biosynthesis/type III secretory pathway chaperone